MLEVKNLSIFSSVGSFPIVRDVSFTVAPGETYALVGESGCGKSMTALSLLRLLPPGVEIRSGSVRCGGCDVFAMTEREMTSVRGSKMSLVFQEPSLSLNPVVRVGDQIQETLLLHPDASGDSPESRVLYWLKRVGFSDPERIARSFPHELSGGQKQRIMIAVALAAGSSVVIADEPTTALDVTLQAQILDLLNDLKKERRLALLLITHDLALVKHYADRVGLMYAGEIVEEASVHSFFSEPQHPYAKGLLRAVPRSESKHNALDGIPGHVPAPQESIPGCRFAPRCGICRKECRQRVIPLRAMASDRSVRCLFPGDALPESVKRQTLSAKVGEIVLQIQNLTVDYEVSGGFFRQKKSFRAVDDVSLELRRGETLALIGESGSGKTTLAKTLLRLADGKTRVQGQVILGGMDVLKAGGRALLRLRRFAQIVFQDPFGSFDPRMTIRECIAEGMLALGIVHNASECQKEIDRLLKVVGLTPDCADRLPHEFSGGQRQRIALARALAVRPQLVICDEPTSALDVSVQAQILNLMRSIQKETGVSYLFITHNVSVVECMADRIAVMRAGRLVESGRTEDVLTHPRNDYTKQLLACVPQL